MDSIGIGNWITTGREQGGALNPLRSIVVWLRCGFERAYDHGERFLASIRGIRDLRRPQKIFMNPLLRTTLFLMLASILSVSAEEAPKTPTPISKEATHPAGVNIKLMSEDPSYGYSQKNPIEVGSKGESGSPRAEREYFDSLVDSTGKAIKYERLGSGGANAEGKPLDIYTITLSNGDKFRLWIDMYHPKNKPAKQPSPVGLYKKKD